LWHLTDDNEITPNIHPTAELGHGCVVHDEATVGPGAMIGRNVVLYPGVALGSNCAVGDNAVLGKPPQLGGASTAKAQEAGSPLLIGDGVRIGAHATICCGTELGPGATVGDYALVRERVKVGANSLIGAFVVVENDVSIGSNVKIQTKAYITALTVIEDFAFIAPCVITTNDNFMGRTEERFKHKRGATVKRGARVGAGAVLLPGVVIGAEAFVAAGSVVTRDVPEKKLVMGAPARIIRDVPGKEWVDQT
jgi:UDP-2-acetamido-3-amino-2,3-dideoxy-glucuronate N-acetyltransferase